MGTNNVLLFSSYTLISSNTFSAYVTICICIMDYTIIKTYTKIQNKLCAVACTTA